MKYAKPIITAIFLSMVVSGCSVVAPVASEAVGGKVGEIMGNFLDKPLTISDQVSNNKTITIENQKWRQMTEGEINVGFIIKISKPCRTLSLQGSAYVGDLIIDQYMYSNLKTQANAKYVVNQKIYLREKRYADKVTLDSVECL